MASSAARKNRMNIHRVALGTSIGIALLSMIGSCASGGTAKASVTTVDGTFSYAGGSCINNQGGLVVNIGVLPSDAPVGRYPDYFGASIDKVPGHFDNAVVTFNKNGKKYAIGTATGEATATGASFSGPVMLSGGKATGSFSC